MAFSDDDDVTVTDYPEEDVEITPKSNYLDKLFGDVFDVLGSHGWILLGTIIALIYIWFKFIQPQINLWLRTREEEKYAAKYHKDPDLARKEREKMEQARLKLQEKYEENARLYKEKMKEKELLKKEQQEVAFQGDGVRLGDGSEDNKKNNHKPAYNPLMGSSSLPSYRPPRRTACSRGNCG